MARLSLCSGILEGRGKVQVQCDGGELPKVTSEEGGRTALNGDLRC